MFVSSSLGFLVATGASAQDEPGTGTRSRPKVALVLSGGGALGIAHVGVIQELERMGIHPDLVVGTSMGAIVGGLYSVGYRGDELETVVREIDWAALFDDTPPRDGLSFRQKQDQADFPVKPRFRLKDGTLSLPSGLVSDQNLLLTLRELVGAKGAVADFDRLSTPFRCVAADIETGAPVVLKSGDLASAIRASFSVPGVFAPMPYDNRLLVDGGMAMNIPVEVALAEGADIVIVVRLNNTLKTKDEIKTALDVVSQSLSLLIVQNETAQIAKMRPQDVLIEVDLAGFSSSSFDQAATIIAPGREAALKAQERLDSVPRSSGMIAAPLPPPEIDYISISNDTRLADEVIAARLDVKTGQPLNTDQLNRDLTEIYALGAFERVDHKIVRDGTRTGLEINVIERPGAYDYIRAGVTLETNLDGSAGYLLSFDYTRTAVDSFNAEFRVEGVIGDALRLQAEYFQPLDAKQSWFVLPRVGFEARDVPIFATDGYKVGEYRAYYGTAALEAGRQFEDWGEIRIGIERGIGKANLEEGFAPLDDLDIDIGQVTVSGGIDTLDQPYFARTGTRARARWVQSLEALGAGEDYQTIQVGVAHAESWGSHTLILNAEGGTTLTGEPTIEALFRLGGPFNLSGLERNELSGEAYGRAGMIYAVKINDADPTFFGVPLYAGMTVEAGNAWADRDDASLDDVIVGGSVFLGADTLLGPAYIGYGHAEGGRETVFLFLGRPF
ncbi:MAG: patatin-like phospholipase family protein [Alphaproteobacteria bacterium]|nr:patatin-like phospholipase family protein [Alphaproteobacteria bacterium]